MKLSVDRPPTPPPTKYILELTEREAVDLGLAIGVLYGPPEGTVRETTDPLWGALYNALPESGQESLMGHRNFSRLNGLAATLTWKP